MSEIALYNLLKRIPDVSDDEAKEAVADVVSAKDVATKSDIAALKVATQSDIAALKVATKSDITELKAETKADIAKLKEELTWRLVIAIGIYTAIISFITKVL